MAYTVRLRQSCSRYLNPSWQTTNVGPVPPASVQGHSHQTSSSVHPPVVSHSQSALVSSHQTCYRNHILCKSEKDNFKTYNKISHGFKTSVQAKYGSAKPRGSYIDMGAFLRMLGSLHIDLPKGFTWRKFDEQLHGNKWNNEVHKDMSKDDSCASLPEIAVQPVKSDLGISEETIKQNAESINVHSSIEQNEGISREQHDFLQAMTEQNSSVKNFYKGQDLSCIIYSEQSSSISEKPTLTTVTTTQSSSPLEATSNLVKHLASYLPGFSGQKSPDPSPKQTEQKIIKRQLIKESIPRSVVERKTRGLVKSLKFATSTASKLVRLEELCRHLATHPEAKFLASKEKVIPCLLRLRSCKDVTLRERAMEGLSLVGYIDPVQGRGIKVLSLDGGGTRGLVAIEILRRIEDYCKQPIHKLFDYICGVSTGSLIAVMIGVHKLSLDEVEHLYKKFSSEMFNRYKLMGVGKLMVSHGYYDAQLWEKILQENIGPKTFLEATRDAKAPKLAAVSTLMNMTKLSNYLFRNYTYPQGAQSSYPGSCQYALWQAIRASSAAPMYYQEYQLDEWIHQDGGIITNNPTAIALHEAKLLWPTDSIQCVISLGTGRYEPSLEPEMTTTGLRNKVQKIIQSATDTEAVHLLLNDLLPPSAYYRFNPYMSENFTLDEIRVDSWDQMLLDTQLYCRKNRYKLEKASDQLLQDKMPHQKALDWLKLKRDELT